MCLSHMNSHTAPFLDPVLTVIVLTSSVICHVVGITYQHIDRWLLAEMLGDLTGEACCCLCQSEGVRELDSASSGRPIAPFLGRYLVKRVAKGLV